MSGPGEVLELIRDRGALTRAEVLDITGLSRMTVSGRIDALLESGYIVEKGTDRVTGGRPSRRLQFNTAHAALVAATVDTTHTTVALTDLAGNIAAEERIQVAVADGPDRTLHAIIDSARGILEREEVPAGHVGGIGISVPGPVDPDTGRPSQPPIMPGWDAYPIV
ncbi:MAG TPA: winged helix-turn-helix transcriptional regulator, partial [Microbacterium sp.]|nr:winged helix-turn-helix transcriptional regulator [Microbacterium sp.]